jgi:hypothetical protein
MKNTIVVIYKFKISCFDLQLICREDAILAAPSCFTGKPFIIFTSSKTKIVRELFLIQQLIKIASD